MSDFAMLSPDMEAAPQAVRFRTLPLSVAGSEALLSDLQDLQIPVIEVRLIGMDGEEWRGCVILRADEPPLIERVTAALRAHAKIRSHTVERGTFP